MKEKNTHQWRNGSAPPCHGGGCRSESDRPLYLSCFTEMSSPQMSVTLAP